jgi:hypothetical protein
LVETLSQTASYFHSSMYPNTKLLDTVFLTLDDIDIQEKEMS